MGDRVSSFTLTFDGDAGTVNAVLSQLKAKIKSDVSDIQATADKLDLFRNLQQNATTVSKAFFDTRQRVDDLRAAIDLVRNSGGTVTRDLANQLKDAEKAAGSASIAYVKYRDSITQLRTELTKAGVDTRNLAAEQQRLAAAAAQAAAKQTLGFKTLGDVQPEIDKLRAAFVTLASSGTLSTKQIALAQQQLNAQIDRVRQSVTGLATATRGGPLTQFFSSSIIPALGLATAAGAAATAIKEAVDAGIQYQQRLAEIRTVTNLSKDETSALGAEVRKVAEEYGVDLNEALKGTQELLRSGVPRDNVLDAVGLAAKAAAGGVADFGTGVKVVNLLLDNFGADVGELPDLFDKIVRGSHDGGASFKEFADGAGPLLNVARAAGVSFDDLLATLTVLVDKSGDAGKSMSDLTKIITQLQTSEARDKLRDLGITGDSLTGTFQQLGARGLSLSDVLGLDLASGGKRAASSIAALTSNAKELPEELARIQASSGETSRAAATMFNTPAERAKRFDASLRGLKTRLGEVFGSSSVFASEGAKLFNVINETIGQLSEGKFGDAVGSINRLYLAFQGIPVPAQQATKATAAFSDAQRTARAETAKTAAALASANKDLTSFSKLVADGIKALQDAASRNLADVQTNADLELAALERGTQATSDTAAKRLAIEKQLSDDRLTIIQRSEADITAALDKELAAREAMERKEGVSEKQIAQNSAQARIAALAPVLAEYQQHYADLLRRAQDYAAQADAIDRARKDFNEGIEQQLFNIRLQGLSSFDQYVAKSQEADRLIAAAQTEAAKGTAESAENAKKFANDAIAVANTLGEVTDQNGTKLVTALQTQTTKTDILKRSADAVNTAYENAGASAKKGSDETQLQIGNAKKAVDDLRGKLDVLKINLEQGLVLKIHQDEDSISKAFATINELTKDRTVVIHTQYVGDSAPVPGSPGSETPSTSTGGLPGSGEHFARGGMVGTPITGFAAGGHVFHRPAWSKVPGIGNTDTVPALLNEGSFVIRKAASQFYGDSAMTRLARGYAAGGTVTKDVVRQYAETKWGFDPFSSKVYDPGNIGGSPGLTGTTAPESPNGVYRPGDTFQDKFEQRTISLDSRPIPEALITAANVIQYAREMLNAVGQNNPLLGTLGPSLLDGIRRLEQTPNNQALLTSVLQAAETIGANPYLFAMWGKTTSSNALQQPEWFIDWLTQRGLVGPDGNPTGGAGGLPAFTGGNNAGNTFANRFFGQKTTVDANNFALRFFQNAIPAAGPPPQLLQLIGAGPGGRNPKYFEGGGESGTDSVPAMLTPGEFVVSKPAVDRVGAPLLWAINEMRLPKADLSHLLEPPRIARFASGGIVGSASAGPAPAGGVTGAAQINSTVNIAVSAQDLFSEANIRRHFLPVWNKILQRSS